MRLSRTAKRFREASLAKSSSDTAECRWTQSDPNAHVVVEEGPVRVFEIKGPLDPAGCAGQQPLSQEKLHSVPNLNSTLKSNH